MNKRKIIRMQKVSRQIRDAIWAIFLILGALGLGIRIYDLNNGSEPQFDGILAIFFDFLGQMALICLISFIIIEVALNIAKKG